MYALACAAVALGQVLIRGPDVLLPYHIGVLGMVGLYLVSGTIGGLIFGLFMPLGRTLVGAVFLGTIVFAPIAVLMTIVVVPDAPFGSGKFVFVSAAASLLGPFCGAAFWIRNNERT